MKTSTQVRTKATAPAVAKQAPTRTKKPPSEFKIVRLRECPVDHAFVDNPDHVEKFWRQHVVSAPWFNADKECLVVFLLNTRYHLLGFEMLSQGTKDTLLVNVAEVFRLAAMRNASAIIIAHNHPSGDTSPSEADIKVTRACIRAGEVLKIELIDHVVLGRVAEGRAGRVSLRELGYFYDPAQPATPEQSTARVAAPTQPVAETEAKRAAEIADARAFRARESALIAASSPAELADAFQSALRKFRESASQAAALALMNGELIEKSIKGSDGWERFDGLDFGESVAGQAREALFAIRAALDDLTAAHEPLVTRASTFSAAVGQSTVTWEVQHEFLERIGCKVEHETGRNFDQSTGALLHLLELQSWLLVDRRFTHAAEASDEAIERLELRLKNMSRAAIRLGEAVAITEFNRAQRQAA